MMSVAWFAAHGAIAPQAASASDVWHLDEVVVRIGGKKCWLWRAVDQYAYVLVRLLKKQECAPKRIVTDKLRSYGAAKRQVMPHVDHRSHKGLNNRAENSHLSLRKREQTRQAFRSIRSLQHFVSIFSPPETISFLQVPTSPLTRSECIAKTLLLNGEPRRSNLPEIHPVASTRLHDDEPCH